jgi:hypothetical protein
MGRRYTFFHGRLSTSQEGGTERVPGRKVWDVGQAASFVCNRCVRSRRARIVLIPTVLIAVLVVATIIWRLAAVGLILVLILAPGYLPELIQDFKETGSQLAIEESKGSFADYDPANPYSRKFWTPRELSKEKAVRKSG